jgi:hypothetical protein
MPKAPIIGSSPKIGKPGKNLFIMFEPNIQYELPFNINQMIIFAITLVIATTVIAFVEVEVLDMYIVEA